MSPRAKPLSVAAICALPPRAQKRFLATLTPPEKLRVLEAFSDWSQWARPNQKWPKGAWRFWLLASGRGAGKTRCGAEYTHRVAERNPGGHIALVARSAADARDTMIDGESGLLHTGRRSFVPIYEPSKRRLRWPNGCWATVYTAEQPENLRGPNICFGWADELASWRYQRRAWDMLMFTLRAGTDPRVIITTTPKPTPLYRELLADPASVVTRGSTYENAENLAPSFLAYLRRRYEGTNLGRQELHAELLDESEGALWQRAWLEHERIEPDGLPKLDRIVVAIDPSVTSHEESSECGIVVAGARYNQPPVPDDYYVLADLSEVMSPMVWAKRALDAYDTWGADRVVGEVNHGGDLIETTLRTVRREFPYRKLTASRGKRARAEPISALSEQQRLHMLGFLPELEDQLCNWDSRESDSPDRLDAMVWAITELMSHRGLPPIDLSAAAARDRVSQWAGAG